jgi:hypothetical protein
MYFAKATAVPECRYFRALVQHHVPKDQLAELSIEVWFHVHFICCQK